MGSSSSKGTIKHRPSPERRRTNRQHTPTNPIIVGPSSPAKPDVSPAKPSNNNINNNNNNNNRIVYRDSSGPGPESTTVNSLMENMFLISLGSATGHDLPACCILLKDLAKKTSNKQLDRANIEEAVFERLLLKVPTSQLLTSKSNTAATQSLAEDTHVLSYLFECFLRCQAAESNKKYDSIKDDVEKCVDVVLQNCKTCLLQPNLFPKQCIHIQLLDTCLQHKEYLIDKERPIHKFLVRLAESLETSDTEGRELSEALTPLLSIIQKKLTKEFTLQSTELMEYLSVLNMFTIRPSLGQLFMEFSEPPDWTIPVLYEHTLIGTVLSFSSCPRRSEGPYEFYTNPLNCTKHEIHTTQVFIWQRLSEVCECIFRLLFSIIKLSPELRHAVLYWLGRCLQANRGKPDLWSAHEAEVFDKDYCSDGFCLNLCYVMLQLSQPFSVPNSEKLLRIKPSYCIVDTTSRQDAMDRCVHAKGLPKDTPLIPRDDDSAIETADAYHFISECYFLTQQALHIGYHIVFKLIKLNNNINRLDKLHTEMKETYPRSVVELVRMQLSKELCWYLNIKAAVTEHQLTKQCLNFHIASASWLVQAATCDTVTHFDSIKFPLSLDVPHKLSCLPEFILTNITNFISTIDLFRSMDMLKYCNGGTDHLMTLILVFMGQPSRVKNSDIRAQLAEILEALLPRTTEDGSWDSSSGCDEALFSRHPLISHLSETLLNVFVSIEMTGQSVDAERKFNYRKSMHRTLQYIWKIPMHRQAIKNLSEEALRNLDNTEPPLFLRFINLLINDAIFLLDEALDHMRQIREQEQERERGDWKGLSAEQYRDKETGLRFLGMVGKHRNVMANHTIYSLEIITREIRKLFCHPVMVDRIAGMLNYFLQHLVGPKQRNYKVRDRREYEFKPEQIVSDITHIYMCLGRDEQFCKAVLGETRSFSHTLFQQAITVLTKIGVAQDFISKFEDWVKKLQTMGAEQMEEEETLAAAPEEFLDPIMGTLMLEPVILPTSNTTVDKAVIARHLLSDQMDPFNRQPLSLNMVIPNTELKARIDRWRADQKKS